MNFSYGLSRRLELSLQKIDSLRVQILLSPLSPKTELRLRWEAMLNKVYYSLLLSGSHFSKSEIVKPLKGELKTQIKKTAEEILKYKQALDYIHFEHLASQKIVTTKTIVELHSIACFGRLKKSDKDLKQLLDYLQTTPDHPVIQAGVAHIQLQYLSPFAAGNQQMSFLTSYLFFYKHGFDFRGLLVLEEYWHKNLPVYKFTLKSAMESQNYTLWLEYFAESLIVQLEKVIKNIESIKFETNLPSVFWELSDRERGILSLLQEPGSRVTNKKAQSRFNISQITASRDLTHLKTLGLILSHGKARSIYYTKV